MVIKTIVGLTNNYLFKEQKRLKEIYSRTSVAETLMARYHGCFELVLESLVKNPLAADLG